MNKITTVLLDLDGTLLDTAPDLGAALNNVLELHHRQPLPLTKIRPFSSTGTRGLLHLGFQIEETDPQYPKLREQFLQAYHKHLNDRTSIFPGMERVLQHLQNQNMPWGVVTNKPAHLATQLLEYFNLIENCACVIGGDTLAKRKPDPEPLLYACEIIGCTTAESIYIGDAERDITAAKRANMRSIAALYGYITEHENPEDWQADFYVDHPEQIIIWLENK